MAVPIRAGPRTCSAGSDDTRGMLLFHCRAGYEADCAAELTALAAAERAGGRAEYRPGQAHVLWVTAQARDEPRARRADWVPDHAGLVFARQMLSHCRTLELPARAQWIETIVAAAKRLGRRFALAWLEAPDADGARQLLAGIRPLAEPLQAALREARVLGEDRLGMRLHVCFLDRDRLVLGASDPRNSAPWPMGIPRLRFPAGAPSRSGLKLTEALATFIDERELLGRLRAGRVAIDLGAAPGGWSQVLAARGIRVVAVDNGPIAQAVLDTQLVEHRREDAFRFRPDRPVDWMVCDVVAAPARIAALVAQWIARGWCRETIFNLKLPNKDRWQEVVRCQRVIETALAGVEGRHALRIKHLYHDRDEVTGHLRRL
ncbi:MAG: 23S rRNA (cytidine(2498)-2'-O)-methyltransferase RlmM [Burkholderiales bacterium]|nr:23S rRNA (cytidine(2498)-2'-O)-methyltransferase RlmM [Burkholderiales bacterium]